MKKFLILILSMIAFLFIGCNAKVYDVYNSSIPNNGSQKIAQTDIEKSIIKAGASLGWVMKKIKDGEMQGTLNLRNHIAIVSIKYNQEKYSILHVNSKNLDYKPGPDTIHSNYNSWIQNLDRAIQVQLNTVNL